MSPPFLRLVPITLLSVALAGCNGWPGSPLAGGRRSAGDGGLGALQRRDPALSGDGRWLASVVEQPRGPRLLLQDQRSGRVQPLRHLGGLQGVSSPALSWNGRYLVALVQDRGPARVVLEDRLRGRWQTLPLRLAGEAERLSLAPDASRLAVQWRREGRTQLQVLELGSVLEPDRPAGSRVLGGGAGS